MLICKETCLWLRVPICGGIGPKPGLYKFGGHNLGPGISCSPFTGKASLYRGFFGPD